MRVLLSVLALCLTCATYAAVITVTPGGELTVQAALDRAKPGDTVRLQPGVYHERVSFSFGGEYLKPVTLEGEPGAVIDGSTPITPDWQPATDIAPGVWRAKIPFLPFTVTADGKIVTMLDERRVDPRTVKEQRWQWPYIFQHGIEPSGWVGVKALGMYQRDTETLLIRFQDDRDPRTIPMTFAPRVPCVDISSADRCVVRGVALRNAAFGVRIEASLGSVVENCSIGPVDYGVWLDSESDRCTIRFNEIFMNPYAGANPRLPGAWDNWQAHKTGGFYDRYGVQINQSLGGHEIHDNNIHDVWDGIEDRGAPGANRGLRIHHNLISNCSDDGLEPNGAEEDCRWNDNLVEQCICGFRIKAPKVGPLYAYRNVFFSNSEDYRNYGEVELKPAFVYVYHNTCTAGAAIQSNKVFGIGTPNYHYYNNLFWCKGWWGNSGKSVDPNWKGDYNVYVRRETDPRWDTGRELAARLGLDAHSLWVTSGDPSFTDAAGRDASLKADSPARGRGVDLSSFLGKPLPGCEPGYFTGPAPDCGAVPFGSPMPKLPRTPAQVEVVPAGSWPGPEPPRVLTLIGPNLVQNGGFEEGLKGWGTPTTKTFKVAADGAAEGASRLQISATQQQETIRQTIKRLKPGGLYLLVYQSRLNTISDIRIIVRNLANAGYLAQGGAHQSKTWRRTSLTFTAPAAEVGLEISPRAQGVCELDGMSITVAPQPD
jgi:hypothetical protein